MAAPRVILEQCCLLIFVDKITFFTKHNCSTKGTIVCVFYNAACSMLLNVRK